MIMAVSLSPSARVVTLCLSVFVLASAGMAQSDEACDELKSLMDLARAAPESRIENTLAETCNVTRELSGRGGFDCVWAYPYRASEARDRFDRYSRALQVCFDGHGPLEVDQPVNHPDFYELHQLQLDEVSMSVSIKDKSAQQATYVFVRIVENKLE